MSSKPTMAVFGGSFSPPTTGHAMTMSWALWTGMADVVLMVPTFAHPFGKNIAPYEHRVLLCNLLCEDMQENRVHVSIAESNLPTPSYSINLLRHLRDTHPEHRIRMMMGTDLHPTHSPKKWYGFEDIMAEFDPIWITRPGYRIEDKNASPVFPDISSTLLRDKFAANDPSWRGYTTRRVAEEMERSWVTQFQPKVTP